MFSSLARRRRGALIALGAVLVLAVMAIVGYLVLADRTGDVSNPDVEFVPEPAPRPPPAPPPPDRFAWPLYGYTKNRTRELPAPRSLKPPFRERWRLGGRVLLEFPPVLLGRSLYLLKNNGSVYAVDKDSGRVRWRRNVGRLAAASPAVGHGRVHLALLEGPAKDGTGRIYSLSTRNGRIRWARKLPSRAETSPLLHHGSLYVGSENGTLYALRARDGQVRWTYTAGGAIKGGPALHQGTLYFGDYGGEVHAVRTKDGSRRWSSGTSGTRLGFGSGQFYSTPAVAFGRVYIGNTDGRVYSLSAKNGDLAWAKQTGDYVYASPAVAAVPRLGPTVYIGSYDGTFYALNARSGGVRWTHEAGGRISGSATLVGSVVYFSNLAARSTTGLGARTGRPVFRFPSGAFNPVISDGERIYLTGYAGLFALEPRGRRRRAGERERARPGTRRRSPRRSRRPRAPEVIKEARAPAAGGAGTR